MGTELERHEEVRTTLKNYTKLAIKMNKCLQEADVPKWTTKEKITLIQEDPIK